MDDMFRVADDLYQTLPKEMSLDNKVVAAQTLIGMLQAKISLAHQVSIMRATVEAIAIR